ncbi:hypothetical protein ACFQT0_16685 [Hymenobacter humi]|uniref:STAS/SEC14 domain-containing protein n=1 Tax=Hymenobacter humi TaxID=1411620 RepID=A0ABW2U5V3_9BACT
MRGRSRRTLSAEEVTLTCEVLLAAALHRRCAYWLLDGRVSRQEQPVELHEWLHEEYFPRVRTELGQPPCIALLVAPVFYKQLLAMAHNAPVEWPTWGARVNCFKEEDAALAWLRQQGAQERERTRLLAASTGTKGAWSGKQLSFHF